MTTAEGRLETLERRVNRYRSLVLILWTLLVVAAIIAATSQERQWEFRSGVFQGSFYGFKFDHNTGKAWIFSGGERGKNKWLKLPTEDKSQRSKR